jgi:hypothetical protein
MWIHFPTLQKRSMEDNQISKFTDEKIFIFTDLLEQLESDMKSESMIRFSWKFQIGL